MILIDLFGLVDLIELICFGVCCLCLFWGELCFGWC